MFSGILRLPGFWSAERQQHERAMDLLSIFDMQNMAGAVAGSLPYGAQRRLEIVRALATNNPTLRTFFNGLKPGKKSSAAKEDKQ